VTFKVSYVNMLFAIAFFLRVLVPHLSCTTPNILLHSSHYSLLFLALFPLFPALFLTISNTLLYYSHYSLLFPALFLTIPNTLLYYSHYSLLFPALFPTILSTIPYYAHTIPYLSQRSSWLLPLFPKKFINRGARHR